MFTGTKKLTDYKFGDKVTGILQNTFFPLFFPLFSFWGRDSTSEHDIQEHIQWISGVFM